MKLIRKYFPDLSNLQLQKLGDLQQLYKHWNARVNVISRKDIGNLYERHVLHSMSIAKVFEFVKNTKIIDIGTGGGFPGIPLAILYPDVHFHLVDSVRKKVQVVQSVKIALDLENVKVDQFRVEEIIGKYDFIVTRAVTNLSTLNLWAKRLIKSNVKDSVNRGVICLKGGNLRDELSDFKEKVDQYFILDYFREPFFAEKYILFFSVNS